MEKLSGKINYTTYFKFKDLTYEKITKCNAENSYIDDFNVAASFTNNLAFEPERIYCYLSRSGLTNTKTSDLSIFANLYEELDIVEVIVNFTFNNANTDDIVFLHHIFSKDNVVINDKNSIYNGLKIQDITNEVIKKININSSCLHKEMTTIIELNDCENSSELINYYNDINVSKELYGMFVGDEGYKNVPDDLVNDRIKNIWSSRNFVSFFAFQNNFLIINLIDSDERKKYLEIENKFQNKYHGNLNKYFTFDPKVAGLNHGFLFAIESVLVVKTLAKSYFSRVRSIRENNKNYKETIASIKTDREELELVLSNFDKVGIAELGVLEYKIIEKVQVIPLIDEIKYMLELVESKLDAEYSEKTNFKVDLLTGISALISLIALIYTIFDHLG